MERTYCYICRSKLDKKADRMWHCEHCDQTFYENPRPCADLAIFNNKGEVLLSKRAFEPSKGKYDMPGGFIEYDETAEEAALREAEEELSIKRESLSTPKYVLSYNAEYPWGKETYKLLVLLLVAKVKGSELKIIPQDDVSATEWVKPDDIDVSKLGNPHLIEYIRKAHEALSE